MDTFGLVVAAGWVVICSNPVLVSGAVDAGFAVKVVLLGVIIFLSVETDDVIGTFVFLFAAVVKFFPGPVTTTPPVVAGVVEEIFTADGDKLKD